MMWYDSLKDYGDNGGSPEDGWLCRTGATENFNLLIRFPVQVGRLNQVVRRNKSGHI